MDSKTIYTKEEEQFIKYWEQNRLKKKKLLKTMLWGLPSGLFLFVAILLNFFSGWYKRASMVANADPSLLVILLIAGIIIVAFTVIFSSSHKWDRNEAYYQELINRKINL